MTARITKLLLLFSGLLLSLSLAAQYPSNPIKSRLGWQTTGDGLVYRGSGAPAYSPGTLFNAWMYLDTTNFVLYGYIGFQWQRLPLVNNGLNADGAYHQLGGSLVENTTVSTGTYNLILGKTSGTNYAYTNIYGSGEGAGLFNSYQNGDYEVEINAQGGVGVMQVENFVDGGNSSLTVNRDGFTLSYLHPSLGVSQFTMDSTRFFIRTLPSFASHAAADAGTSTYQMYTLDNSRRIYVNQGAATADILGTGTADRSARWSATNTLGAGSWSDNLTRLQAQVPVQFQALTTAGLPTGVTGYHVYNTTINGPGWYQGSRWAYALESTFARGTSTYVPFFDANGQVTQSSSLYFNPAANGLVFQSAANFGGLFFGATRSPQINFGSGAVDVNIGMPTVTNDFFTNATAGDLILRVNNTSRRIHFGFNTAIALTIAQNKTTLTHPTIGGGFELSGRSGGYVVAGSVYGGTTVAGDYFTDAVVGSLSLRAAPTANVLIGADSSVTGTKKSILRVFQNRRVGINVNPTQELDVSGDVYIMDSTRLTTTPAHIAISGLLTRDANGWVGLASIGTGLSYSGGVLSATGSADGNGIYTGSGTLASHTTRAAIPSTGNLLFTQKYNSNADSAFIQFVNDLDGNREVRIGLTDTASTGRATLTLKQDADNEVMAWDLQSSDGSGATRLTGDGGNISATVDEGFEFQVSGMVRAKREAYAEITSTSSPQTLSSTYSDNLINQGGTQATFTLEMPASPDDGQVCYITFNNAISTLTIDGNGETIVGSAVTTGVAGSQRKFKFYAGIGWIKQY